MLIAALSLLVVGCSAPPDAAPSIAKVTSPPTPSGSPQVATPTAMLSLPAPSPSPNGSPSPSPNASPSPAAIASPAAITSPVASPAVPASPVAIIVTPAASGPLTGPRFRIVAEQSEASYRARETFVSQPGPAEAVGRTKSIQGELQLESDGILRGQILSMQIDLRTLASDQARRDSFIRQNTLQTDRFPFVEFRSTGPAGPALFRPGEEAAFQIPGLLTVKGNERPIVWEARARLEGDAIIGTATARVKLTDFGLEPPRLAILSVEDEMTWQIDLVAERVQ
jgi:polyisoprenoid-binding protein YceI